MPMDLREYDHIAKSPDTFPKSTLLSIKKVLEDIDSPNVGLIDKILTEGYIEPPKGYKWHGFYRLVLTDVEMEAVLDELFHAKEVLKDHPQYQGKGIVYVGQYFEYWSRGIYETPIPYTEAINTQPYYDLRSVSLKKFCDFIFEHDVPTEKKNPEHWYYDGEMWIDYDIDEVIDLYIKLFAHPESLNKDYTNEKLEQGCWAMMGPNLEIGLENIIWNEDVDIKKRTELISAMYHFYNNFYKLNPLHSSCEMWWDSLAYNFYEGGPRSRENKNDRIIQDAMFETLKRIIIIDSKHCQSAALHGLGHLRHPDTEKVINDYLRKHPELTNEEVIYAKACIAGDIM